MVLPSIATGRADGKCRAISVWLCGSVVSLFDLPTIAAIDPWFVRLHGGQDSPQSHRATENYFRSSLIRDSGATGQISPYQTITAFHE